MAGLQDFRKQHPEYDDMPDAALADSLYKKFYSDMPRADFDAKMGIAPAKPAAGSEAAMGPATHEVQPMTPPPTIGERFGTGVVDPLYGGAQFAAHTSPDWLTKAGMATTNALNRLFGLSEQQQPTPASELDKRIAKREADYQAARGPNAGFDWYRLGGNVASMLPMAIAAPESLGGTAVMGAAQGAMQPVTNALPGNQEGNTYWGQKGWQTGLSAGSAVATNLAGRALSRIISPRTSPQVKELVDAGITPTPGQIMGGGAKRLEEKATSIPGLGDAITSAQRRTIEQFNKSVYQNVLNPIGKKAPDTVGRDAVNAVSETVSNAYDDLLPRLTFKPDNKFVSDLSSIALKARDLPAEESRQFSNYIQNTVAKQMGKTGEMTGEAFKKLESDVGAKAAQFGASNDVYQQNLGAVFGEFKQALKDALYRANPKFQGQLGRINESYARLVRLQGAAAGQGASEGIFTPAQFSAAVRAADKSVRKAAFARGNALMQNLSDAGKAVLGNTYPNSGTPGRMLTALLAGGGLAYLDPRILGAVGLASVPYLTPFTQRMMANALVSRPAAAPAVASALRSALPLLQTGAAASLPSLMQP